MRTLFISFILAVLILFLIQRKQETFIDFNNQENIAYQVQKGSMEIKENLLNTCSFLLPNYEIILNPNKSSQLELKYYQDSNCERESDNENSRGFYKIITKENIQSSETTPEMNAETTPEMNAETTPKMNAETTPEMNAETTPEMNAETTPEMNAETTPEMNAETTPEMNAETTPEMNMETSLEMNNIEGFSNVILAKHF